MKAIEGTDFKGISEGFDSYLSILAEKYGLDREYAIHCLYAFHKEGKLEKEDVPVSSAVLAYALSANLVSTHQAKGSTPKGAKHFSPAAKDYLKFYRGMQDLHKSAVLSVLRPVMGKLKGDLRTLAKEENEIIKLIESDVKAELDSNLQSFKFWEKVRKISAAATYVACAVVLGVSLPLSAASAAAILAIPLIPSLLFYTALNPKKDFEQGNAEINNAANERIAYQLDYFSGKRKELFEHATRDIAEQTKDWQFVHDASPAARKRILQSAIAGVETEIALLVAKTDIRNARIGALTKEHGGLLALSKGNNAEFVELENLGVLPEKSKVEIGSALDDYISGKIRVEILLERLKKPLFSMFKSRIGSSETALLVFEKTSFWTAVLDHISTISSCRAKADYVGALSAKESIMGLAMDFSSVLDVGEYIVSGKNLLDSFNRYSSTLKSTSHSSVMAQSDFISQKIDFALGGKLPTQFLHLHTHPVAPKSISEAAEHLAFDMRGAKSDGPALMACPEEKGFSVYYYTDTTVEHIGHFG